MRLLQRFATVLLACGVGLPAAAATFDATSRGEFTNLGAHTAGNLATYAGQGSGTDRHRTFFVFDLATLSQPVTSGVLRLELAGYISPDAAEVFSVYDVTSSVDDLLATQTNRSDIYTDLGDGVYYGVAAAYASAVGTVIEVPLEPDAITDINHAAGGRFAVGVFLETVRQAVGSEAVRFSLNGEPRVHQLVLTEAPYAPPALSLGPELASLVPPAEHAVDAHLVSDTGAPIAGASISFAVVAGPNSGASANVSTDADGAAHYAYTGSAHGVDTIRASFSDGHGDPFEQDVLAFWDADCNANAIPDTCDLSCDGWDGQCAAFETCGGGVDADANGVLDECAPPTPDNAPPDCSLVSANPGMLRRADHALHRIMLGGVSDPDGDAVHLTVDAVFQDEPVDGFSCGSGRPDATGMGSDVVAVRGESLARGDGRVYHVDFTADDGRGGMCEGTVTVCVPRFGLRRSDACVDQGPLYDSSVFNKRRDHRMGWFFRGHH